MPFPKARDSLRAFVDTVDRRAIASWSGMIGVFLFMCALVFYYFSVLKVDFKKSSLLDLDPYPDATEYFGQANALAAGELPTIQIGYEKLPSAFPPGYPAVMLPWLKMLPKADSLLAPFRTNQTIGLLFLLVVFGFYTYLALPLHGGIAALLLATLPGFFTFCRSPMSDASAWLLYALSFIFAFLGLKEERRWMVYLSAALLGLAVNIRLQSLFFLPLLAAIAFFPMRDSPLRWFGHCVAVGLTFLLAASPLLVVNTIQFHSPFKIGGNWYPPVPLFSLENIPSKNAAMFWKEFTLQPYEFLAANLFGTGRVFAPAYVLLVLAGLFVLRVSRPLICIVLADLVFLVFTVTYRYPDGRYYLQLLILLIPLAVLPVAWAINHLLRPKQAIASVGILVLYVGTCLGYPSRTGHEPSTANRAQAWDALAYLPWQRQSAWLIAERYLVEKCGRRPGLVFSDIDPVYLNVLLPKPFVAAPIDEKQIRRWSPTWHYGLAQSTALARRGIEQSLPVYGLFLSRKNCKSDAARLPTLPGYDWFNVPSDPRDMIVQLLPAVTDRAGAKLGGASGAHVDNSRTPAKP